MEKNIVISFKTILFTLATFLTAYILYLTGPVVFIMLFALIITIAMEHPIKSLAKVKVMNRPLGRSTAVILTYFIFIMLLITSITLIIPTVVIQSQKLLTSITTFFTESLSLDVQQIDFRQIFTNNIESFSSNLFSTTSAFLSGVTAFASTLIMAIYMSLDWLNLKSKFFALFKKDSREELNTITNEIETSIGYWIKGQLMLMLIVGGLSFVGLLILGVENALALGLLSGLLEIVPMLGPLIAASVAGVVGLSQSYTKGIMVIALFALIQQLENNLLVPKVMQKVSGFSPVIILIAILVGSRLMGPLGALMSIPVMMIGVILFKHYMKHM